VRKIVPERPETVERLTAEYTNFYEFATTKDSWTQVGKFQPEPWSVEELSHQVGLSRSTLHERFVELTGQAPMQYLANWRMQLGASLLRQGQAKVATIAQDVGYESEAAFARAFKRMTGQPPATWRRAQAAA